MTLQPNCKVSTKRKIFTPEKQYLNKACSLSKNNQPQSFIPTKHKYTPSTAKRTSYEYQTPVKERGLNHSVMLEKSKPTPQVPILTKEEIIFQMKQKLIVLQNKVQLIELIDKENQQLKKENQILRKEKQNLKNNVDSDLEKAQQRNRQLKNKIEALRKLLGECIGGKNDDKINQILQMLDQKPQL